MRQWKHDIFVPDSFVFVLNIKMKQPHVRTVFMFYA